MDEKAKQRKRKSRTRLKLAALAHYSTTYPPSCARCSVKDIDVLCIDHINGGGTRHRKQLNIGAGGDFYQWLKNNNYPEGYQVLCANCNLKKEIERKRALY